MKYTIDDFKKKVQDKYNTDKFTIINFTSMREPCSIRCEICGKIQTLSRAEGYTRKDRLILCDHYIKKEEKSFYERRLENFIQRLKNKFPDADFTVLSFKTLSENAEIKCNKCGQTFNMIAHSLFNSQKKHFCPNCRVRDDTKEVGHKVEYLINNQDNLILLNQYTKITDNLEFKCKNCNGIFKRMPQVFLKSQKCPYCETHSKKYTKEVFQELLNMKFGNEYTIIGEYEGTLTPTLFRHNDCGFIFKSKPNLIITKSPCPKCKRFNSKGEIAIKKLLEQNNINYEQQKRYNELNGLSFDFYIPSRNLLIEFQGEQHYHPIAHFGGEEKFIKQKKNDEIKREFCKNNQIELLEIKYTDIDRIDEILSFLWFND